MKRKLFSVCLLLFSVAAQASNEDINALRIHGRSGENVTILLDDNPVVRFEGSNLVVTTHMNVVNYPSADVVKFTYVSVDPTDVHNPNLLGMVFSFEKESLNVANLTPQTNVSIYAVDGRLICSAMTDANGCASLRLPDLSASVYIVKTSSVTFKIFRP
ncbi:MAG: hypothetical protein K2O61_06180 [Bacteroidaceae bacterium]|nr:hypothetical protein [Bacteroidaceae bacterium]